MSAAVALRRARWQHPEAAAAALVAFTWVLLFLPPLGASELHARAHEAVPALAAAAGWLAMTVAMMLPGVLPELRALALGALWERRRRTVGLFAGGYLGVWAAFGAAVLPLVALAGSGANAVAAILVLAAAWELTPWKWRAARACHRIAPLPPRGRRADDACLRAGVRYGTRCIGACWPFMLAMAASGHASLGLMALLTAVVVTEKITVRASALAAPLAWTLLAAAVMSAVAA